MNCNCDLAGFAEFLNNIADDDMKEEAECYFPLKYQNTPVVYFNFANLNCTKNQSSCIESDKINVTPVSPPKFNIKIIKIDYKIDDTMDLLWSIQKIGYSPDGIYECNISYSVIDEDDYLDLPIKDCISSNNDPKNNSLNLQLQGENKYRVCIRIIYIIDDSVYEQHCLTADYIKPITLDSFSAIKTSSPSPSPQSSSSSSKITSSSSTIFPLTDATNSTLSNNINETTSMTTIIHIKSSITIFPSTPKLITNKTVQTTSNESKDNLLTSTISTEYSSVPIENIILISINESEHKPYLFWNLSVEEDSNFCKLQISITLNEVIIKTERQKCVNGSFYLGNLESENDYKLCISKFYNFTKKQYNCTYFKTSLAFASTESHSNGNIKFPIVALVGLLILALLILIVIVVVLIKLILMKKTRSNQYNVAKEEEEISIKRKSNSYSMNAMQDDVTV